MRRLPKLAGVVLVTLGVLSLGGCNTWEGIRKDARRLGDSITNDKKK